MFNRRRLVLSSAVIVLTLVSHAYTQADDANDYPSEVRADFKTVYDADILAATRTDNEAVAEVGSDDADVIEEIVVIGKNKRQLPDLGRNLGSNPVAKKPSWFDWQFLPAYDLQQADRHFDLFQLNDQIGRVGVVEVFRIRFGHRRSSRLVLCGSNQASSAT